jgi:uncharacterized protein YndB with AHSA1/START domain
MTRTIRIDRTYTHALEKVWHALTDRDALAVWLMPNDFEPRVGHKFNFRTQPMPQFGFDGIVHCEVLECDPPRRLAYSWRGGGLDTVVKFTLEPAADGTRLRFEHGGFTEPFAVAFERMEHGWQKMLAEGIVAVIARHAPTP